VAAAVKWSVLVAGVNNMLRGIDRISGAPFHYTTTLRTSHPPVY
jgi:hypothetical protein